jgi:two-component system, chemotaxis family, sensor kinase CheA
MDRRRFLDLYVSETAEHQRLLHGSLLALEREAGGAALDQAFRSAHTLKGLSAAMGYSLVADLAHDLEDELDRIRQGQILPDAAVIDGLLAAADALGSALAEAVTTPPSDAGESATAAVPLARPRPLDPAAVPPGTGAVALVRLDPDAPIKSARALLILRGLANAGALGSDPAAFPDDFPGDFYIFLSAAADVAAATAAIQAAGDVASVELVQAEPAATVRQRVTPERPAARQVRVETARLDRVAERIGELSVLCGPLFTSSALPQPLADLVARLSTVLAELQHDTFALRMVPVRESFERLPRVVRDAARTVGRQVDLVLTGEDVELDRPILEEIGEPLVHLLRNAVDHGIEEPAARLLAGKPERGRIEVRAERERSSVRITVEDDGRGIQAERVLTRAREAGLVAADAPASVSPDELFQLLSHPGLSTAEHVSALSGRGVGMDVVVSRIHALGGAIEMQTTPGQRTSFSIRLPITLALAHALRVRVGNEEYVIPLTHLAEAVELNGNVAREAAGEVVHVRSETIPLVRLRRLLEVAAEGEEETAVIAASGGRRVALAFDELLGREQMLIKSVEPVTGLLPYFSGATLLADGRPVLVLDPLSVL